MPSRYPPRRAGRLAQNAHLDQSDDRLDRFTAAALPQSRPAAGQLLDKMLHDIRTGLAVIHLRAPSAGGSRNGSPVQTLLDALKQEPGIEALAQPVDALLAHGLPADAAHMSAEAPIPGIAPYTVLRRVKTMRDLAMGGIFSRPAGCRPCRPARDAAAATAYFLRPGPGPLALPPAVGAFLYIALFSCFCGS